MQCSVDAAGQLNSMLDSRGQRGAASDTRQRPKKGKIMDISVLWYSKREPEWEEAESHYVVLVRPENLQLEVELEAKMSQIQKLEDIRLLGLADDWYELLLGKYLRWKYTAPNRYATTSKRFRDAYEQDKLLLDKRIESLLGEPDRSDAELMGFKAKRIRGLGYAGASGLLALIFPHLYGTIDQFVVDNLRRIADLPEHDRVQKMKPMNLSLSDFVLLTDIYRRKSMDLNAQFNSAKWTPRRIDRVLWAIRANA